MIYLLIVFGVAAVGLTITWWRHRPPSSPTLSIDDFSGQMAALAPEERDEPSVVRRVLPRSRETDESTGQPAVTIGSTDSTDAAPPIVSSPPPAPVERPTTPTVVVYSPTDRAPQPPDATPDLPASVAEVSQPVDEAGPPIEETVQPVDADVASPVQDSSVDGVEPAEPTLSREQDLPTSEVEHDAVAVVDLTGSVEGPSTSVTSTD